MTKKSFIHLSRVSRQPRLSANDKGDNAVKPGNVHRSPRIYLLVEENPGKPQLGDGLMKAVRPVIVSIGVKILDSFSWSFIHFATFYV